MAKRLAKESFYVIVGVIVLILVFGVAVSTVLQLTQNEKSDDGANDTTMSKEEAEQKRLGRELEDARAEELKRLIAAEADAQKKADYFIELSLIHFNRGNYDEALGLGTEAERLVKTAKTAALLGDVYYAKKDYGQAAKQYGIAVERSPKSEGSRSPYYEYMVLKKQAEDASR